MWRRLWRRSGPRGRTREVEENGAKVALVECELASQEVETPVLSKQ